MINFYELLTGLTYLFYRPSVPQISIGHQYLFLHPEFKFPPKSRAKIEILKLFTRITCSGAKQKLPLSFRSMMEDASEGLFGVPPLLRKEGTQPLPTSTS